MSGIGTSVGTPTWWKSALIRAARTALIVAVTYLPATYTQAVPFTVLGSAAVVAGVLSILYSLAGIAEATGTKVPWYFALLERVVKTVSQALAGGVLANVVFIHDIDWSAVLATTIASAFGSLLIGVLGFLPESTAPAEGATVPVTTTDADGEQSLQVAPVVVAKDTAAQASKAAVAPKSSN